MRFCSSGNTSEDEGEIPASCNSLTVCPGVRGHMLLPLWVPWPRVQALGNSAGEWASAFSTHVPTLLILLQKSLMHGLIRALSEVYFHAFYYLQAGLAIGFLLKILMKSSNQTPHYQRNTTMRRQHVAPCLGSMLLTHFIERATYNEIMFVLW